MRQPWLGREALRKALNETEDTFIGALPDKGRRLLTEKHAEILVEAFRNLHFMLILLPVKTNLQKFIGNIESIIDQVTNQVAVDGADQITRLQTRQISGAFGH